jgi:hypothetical protein
MSIPAVNNILEMWYIVRFPWDIDTPNNLSITSFEYTDIIVGYTRDRQYTILIRILPDTIQEKPTNIKSSSILRVNAREPRPSLRNEVLRFARNLAHLVARPFLGTKPDFQTSRSLFHRTANILPRALLTKSKWYFSGKN